MATDDEIDLGETINFESEDNDMLIIDPDDADSALVVTEAPVPREDVVWVSAMGSAETVIVSSDEALDRMIIFLDGLRAQLVRRRLKSNSAESVLSASEREIYFDGLGLASDELARAIELAALAHSPDDIEVLISYLRDIQILRFQRKKVEAELDPAMRRDRFGRLMPQRSAFGLNAEQKQRIMQLIARAVDLDSIPNDALHLVLGKSAEFCVEFSSFLGRLMDIFHCPSMPYVVPDYSISPEQAILATGCEMHIKEGEWEIFRDLPQYPHEQREGERIIFFQMARAASPLDVLARYKKLGLRPLDLWEFLAFNARNPAFLKYRPNTTCWDVLGDIRLAACYTHEGDETRRLAVKRPVLAEGFVVGWHFAGVLEKK